MSRKRYTTVEVSEAAGVPRATLQHWIKTAKLSAPPIRLVRNRAVRLWTEAQKKRIEQISGTFKSGPKKLLNRSQQPTPRTRTTIKLERGERSDSNGKTAGGDRAS
jgi:DNA-binding transcriptional MerR regulator